VNSIEDVNPLRAMVKTALATIPPGLSSPLEWLSQQLVGTGVGFDTELGYHLRIYTASPAPADVLGTLERSIASTAMRLIYSGPFRTIGPSRKPIRGGAFGSVEVATQIALEKSVENGTLGAFVSRQGQPCLLSCHHVLNADLGAPIAFRTVDEVATPSRPIATLVDLSQLADNPADANTADWALATLNGNFPFDPTLPNGLGQLDNNPAAITRNMPLVKASQNVQLNGIVVDIDAEIDVTFTAIGNRHFVHQILIEEAERSVFAEEGDSGTIVVTADANPQAVAMVFAVNVFRSDIEGVASTVPLTAAFPLANFLRTYPLIVTSPQR
jgi:hypothetical protein